MIETEWDLEDNWTIIGNYIFNKHEGQLEVAELSNLNNCGEPTQSLAYYPVDCFSDLIDALNSFKDDGLHIKLSCLDFKKLLKGCRVGGDWVQFNRYDFIKDYGKFRRNVLGRDGHACIVCGKPKDLEVHHLYSFKDYLEYGTVEWNGVTLCKECHRDFHRNYGYHSTEEKFKSWKNNKWVLSITKGSRNVYGFISDEEFEKIMEIVKCKV